MHFIFEYQQRVLVATYRYFIPLPVLTENIGKFYDYFLSCLSHFHMLIMKTQRTWLYKTHDSDAFIRLKYALRENKRLCLWRTIFRSGPSKHWSHLFSNSQMVHKSSNWQPICGSLVRLKQAKASACSDQIANQLWTVIITKNIPKDILKHIITLPTKNKFFATSPKKRRI